MNAIVMELNYSSLTQYCMTKKVLKCVKLLSSMFTRKLRNDDTDN